MEEEMETISRALKAIDENNPGRTFSSSNDLFNYFISILDVTFVTKCSAYQQYIQGNFCK